MSDTMTTVRTPHAIMQDLAAVRAHVAVARNALANRQQVNDQLEAELTEAMKQSGIKTQDGSGLQATVAVRRDSRIVKPELVADALAEIGRLGDCTNPPALNATAVKKLAKERGELFPGMEETATEYLTVKAVTP